VLCAVGDLLATSEPQTVLLHGGGGYGKSSAAVAIAEQAQRAGRKVFWVGAHSRDRLESGMREVAARLTSPEGFADRWDATRPAMSLWDILDSYDEGWLLVLDNANQLAHLQPKPGRRRDIPWLRQPAAGGAVLITSRVADSSQWGEHTAFEIGALGLEAGAEIIIDQVGPELADDPLVGKISAQLAGFPLALSIAAAHLARALAEPWADARSTLSEYRTAVAAGLEKLRAVDRSVTPEAALVAVTSELSLGLLERVTGHNGVGVHARPLLRLLAALDAHPIPATSFSLGTDRGVLFTGATDETVAATIGTLLEMGLLEPFTDSADRGSTFAPDRADRDVVALHDLLRESCRNSVDFLSERDQFAMAMVAVVERAVGTLQPEDRSTWPVWRDWAPHLARVLRFCADVAGLRVDHPATKRAAVLAANGAWYLHRAGLHQLAESQMSAVVKVYARVFGPDDPVTVRAMIDLARIVRDGGDWPEAERLFTKIEVIQHRREPDGDDVIQTRNRLANLLRLQDRLQEAVERFDQVIPIQWDRVGEDRDGPAFLDLLSTLFNRALALRGKGQAECDLAFVLEHRRRLLDDDHFETLQARNQRAVILRDLWRLEEALAEFNEVLPRREEVLGLEHRDVLSTRNQLAGTLERMGQLEDALKMWKDVLSVRKRVLGLSHPYTLLVMQHIARVTLDTAADDATTRAEVLDDVGRQLDKLLDLQLAKLGQENNQIWGTQVVIGRLLLARGRATEARELLDTVLGKQIKSLGREHVWTLETFLRLAMAKAAVGDIAGARADAEFVLAKRLEAGFPPGVRDIVVVEAFLAQLPSASPEES
jgi:tetratricopeptide (TPR) repeat protein